MELLKRTRGIAAINYTEDTERAWNEADEEEDGSLREMK